MIGCWGKVSVCILYFLSFFLSGVIHARAQTDDLQPNVEAEELIVQLLTEGKIADLSLPFPEEADRVIGAEFLERLLTGKIIPINQDIIIKYVKIEGTFTFENQVFRNISINQCTFAGSVNLQGSKFENLSLSSCTFLEDVNFQKLITFDSADFTNSQFQRNVDFSFVNIGRYIDLRNTRFSSPEIINFNSMNVGNSAFITASIFEGPVDFGYARISDALIFDKTRFNSRGESSFNSMDVGSSAFFRDTIFSGSLDLGQSRVGTSLDFRGAEFNSEERLRFNSMEISGSLLFQNAIFSGPVFFLYSNIGNLGDFSQAEFNSPLIVSFSFLNIRHGVTFEEASFSGPVNFSHFDSEGSLNLQNAKFLAPETTIAFTDVNIRGDLQIKNATFSGGLLINNTTILNSFGGVGIAFLDPNESISIGQLESQNVSLEFTSFPGSVNFTNCSFNDFSLAGSDPSLSYVFLSLSGTKVMRNFFIGDFLVQSFAGSNLTSLGNGRIENIMIADDLDLSFASFNVLAFQNVSWPKTMGNLELDGFSYHEIIPGENLNNNNWHEVLDLINNANYNSSLYKNLESYLEERGHSDWADQVFIAQKRRERSDLFNWYNLRWWWSQFLDGFILYGKEPGRAFLWSFLIVLIGAFVFKKGKMTSGGKVDESYNSFWYSLDLFIPYIDLGVASKWHPKPKETKLLVYNRIHLILGWLVLPIALFAISGLIR